MNTNDGIFQRALSKLLTEIFDGPPGNEAYLLNPGDPGLLRQLESISAARRLPAANAGQDDDRLARRSRPLRLHAPEPLGRRRSERVGRRRLERELATHDRYRRPVANSATIFRREAETGKRPPAPAPNGTTSPRRAPSSAAHTAYHLGAIRQILAALAEVESLDQS